jgi:hypothetical protein
MDTKVCTKCNVEKDTADFYRSKYSVDGSASWCKHCTNEGVKVYKQTPEGKAKDKALKAKYYQSPKGQEVNQVHEFTRKLTQGKRQYNYKSKYGITIEDYDRMFEEQDGVCASCGQPETKQSVKHFAVDHDHQTGAVRGLLCHRCNLALGVYEDKQLMQGLQNYMDKYKDQSVI